MTKSERPIAVDLFAGAGGMTLGFEQAGFDVLASLEIDPVHCATHEYNFPFSTTICSSAIEISGDEIRSRSRIQGQKVDVVFGGSPCQGFSMIGKRALDDERNELLLHFIRLVLELDANYFVLENVKGLTVGLHLNLLLEVIQEFKSHGYDVVENFQVLNAANYGVPQDRRRLFLMGCKRGWRLPCYPQAWTASPRGEKEPTLFELPTGPNVEDAIGDLPDCDGYEELLRTDKVNARFKRPSEYAACIRGEERESDDYSYRREFDTSLLTSSLRTEHTHESIVRFRNTKPGEVEPISRFYKLDPDGISNTIRAGTPSNRGAFTSPRPIHPTYARVITVREAARLHSYPDWFRFHSTKWHGFRQVGNSVPPRLARAVGSQVIKAMGRTPSKTRGCKELGPESLLYMNMREAAEHFGVDAHVIEPRKRQALEA